MVEVGSRGKEGSRLDRADVFFPGLKTHCFLSELLDLIFSNFIEV